MSLETPKSVARLVLDLEQECSRLREHNAKLNALVQTYIDGNYNIEDVNNQVATWKARAEACDEAEAERDRLRVRVIELEELTQRLRYRLASAEGEI